MKKNACIVSECDSTDATKPPLTFHLIPKDDVLRKKWLKAINRTEDEVNKRSKVCSEHFKNSDYSVTRLNYTTGNKNTPTGSEFKVLKNEAVPSLNLPPKSTFKIKISKKDNNSKEIKVEEVKVKEEKDKEKEKSRMPKKHHIELSPPRARTQSRRAASKEALKQMQLLLDDENDAVEIPDDDIIPPAPSPPPPPPPKKKYKLSHRKSSDGNDRDVIVLKSITNRNAENTLELECFVEQLEEVQKNRIQKMKDEEKELQAKLDSLVSQANAKVIHKGDLASIIEVTEQVQSAIAGAKAPPTNLVLNNISSGQQNYQLVMDPRLGLIVGALNPPSPAQPASQPKVYQGKVQVAQNLQQTPTTSSQNLSGRGVRTRRGAAAKLTPPPSPVPMQAPQTRSLATNQQTRTNANQTRSVAVSNQTRPVPTIQTRSVPSSQTRSMAAHQTRSVMTPPQTRSIQQTRSIAQAQSKATPPAKPVQPPAKATPSPKTAPPPKAAPSPKAAPPPKAGPLSKTTPPPTRSLITAKKSTVSTPQPSTPSIATRQRGQATPNAFSNVRPSESNVQGGLSAGGAAAGKKIIVDLTSEENKGGGMLPDSKEISFNKLQGKTYPSLVVVARPHLRVQDLSVDRPKLDAKVKSVLMHAPTKFTEWLIQQGLVRAEQKCTVHTATPLKLGMYSDVSKFPYSGGYVWISECCPQRFVSVFSGSLFEGSPHPPMVILKLLYHWACQTNIQNVTQWVKVDNLYVKGMFTWLRSICTVAIQTHIRQLGGPGVKVEVGVISLGTTSQDGNQRQVKVEVLGVLETTSKLIRLRAVEPQAEGDRNYKKRFSKILEPIFQWVHPQSMLVADLTVDKQTLIGMGFTNVVQSSANEFGSNKQIMEYLRRIVPRMFQNTLSLLSRQIIQQFLDELVWREWFGTSSLQAFDNLVIHMSEQTRHDSNQSLIVRLNKVAQNPFKNWSIPLTNSTKVVENVSNANKKQRTRKPDPPKVTQNVVTDINRPPKSISPDVPEQMVPLENYYYGTIDTYSKTPSIVLNMKCPFCKATFDNNIQLMNHLFKHAHNVSQDAQLCRYCLTSVTTANDLLKHISTSHPAETKFDNGFVCLICETQYMNPFVLGKHMSKEHCPSELPYQCGTCGYKCSNHKQAIDHFYRTHDNGPTIQCPFCLKSTTVFSSSRNIVQNMNYFIQHLQKHQRKQFARRCGKCNLWFVQKDVLKDHQNRMHVSQRGKTGLIPWNAPRNGVMVPKSRMDKYPGDGEVINFGTLHFNLSKNLMCKECNTSMDTAKHFPSFESCQNPNCQYSTCCTNAMQEHNAKCSKSHNPVAEEKLPFEMFCICGYSDTDGNQLARHLAICERKSAYSSRNEAKSATVTHSMLDVLGLMRKPEEAAKVVSNTKRKSEAVNEEEPPESLSSVKKRKVENLESKPIEEEEVTEAPKMKRIKIGDKAAKKDVEKEKTTEDDEKHVIVDEEEPTNKEETSPETVDDRASTTEGPKAVEEIVSEESKTVDEKETESFEEAPEIVEEKLEAVEEVSEAVEVTSDGVEEAPEAVDGAFEGATTPSEVVEAESKAVEKESETMKELCESVEETTETPEAVVEEESRTIEEVSETVQEVPETIERVPETVEEVPETVEEVPETVEEVPETVEEEKPVVLENIKVAEEETLETTEDRVEAVEEEDIVTVEEDIKMEESEVEEAAKTAEEEASVPVDAAKAVENELESVMKSENEKETQIAEPEDKDDEGPVVESFPEEQSEDSKGNDEVMKVVEDERTDISRRSPELAEVQNHVSSSEPELTTDDIQNLLSDVVGEKLNAEGCEKPTVAEAAIVGGLSNGESLQAEESMEVVESEEVSPMETD
ncbi:relative of woc isoform X2 [Leptinotarsa decemlineata]|uniref:relative of woc isoform X2 n=1 Tax=Leptinotarsa decemlineata TaxID=7539 RepID=UPI003D308A78